MTDVRQARQTTDRPSNGFRGGPRGEPGWVIFSGVMLLLAGAFQFIAGLMALLRQGFFHVGTSSLMVHVGYTPWGWTHIGLGGALALAGLGALTGRTPARVLGIIAALLSAVVALAFLPAFPAWAAMIIGLDVIALYSLCTRWHEFVGRVPMGRGAATSAAMRGQPAGTPDGRTRAGDGTTTRSTTTTSTTETTGDGRRPEDEEEARRVTAERGGRHR